MDTVPVRRGVGSDLNAPFTMRFSMHCSLLYADNIAATTSRHKSCVADIASVGTTIVMYHGMGAVRTADNGEDVP